MSQTALAILVVGFFILCAMAEKDKKTEAKPKKPPATSDERAGAICLFAGVGGLLYLLCR